ncbi:recombinase family protein [Chakrabartyella piscis]|uniref:recombinase family protein n=1 Tax=Chakrabartyella piscis TaxID=2918914 RepID=UPI002958A13B|nr:recombinase family protein [Chakrabartyella piscis]
MAEKEIVVIPPKEKHDRNIKVEQKKLNVAAYCRVSTRFEEQEQSYDRQIDYFTSKILSNQNWNLVEVYADFGKSATALKSRDEFNRLIEDCNKGKIDMVLTKSISRFARNTVDFLKIIRELKAKGIRIIFENEHIDTMDSTGELLITILSSQAQEESRTVSENTRFGIVRKYEQGIVHVNHNKFMGYTKDDEGNLIIVPEEAKIVQKIFDLYLDGLGLKLICDVLESENIKTATRQSKWRGSVIYKMLSCEKYIGDALLQKTYTIDHLTKKRVKNDGIVKQYYIKNNHEPIISKEQFYEVQAELQNRKRKGKGSNYSGKYPLSSLIQCSHCGASYTRTTANKMNPIWQCSTRTKKASKCPKSYRITEKIAEKNISNYLENFKKLNIKDMAANEIKLLDMMNDLHNQSGLFPMKSLRRIVNKIYIVEKNVLEIHFKSGLTVRVNCME